MKPEVDVAISATSELGEGPIWDPATGTLVWLDLLGDRLYRSNISAGTSVEAALDRTVGAVALREDGRLVAAVPEGFADLAEDGSISVFTAVEQDQPGNRMNDGKCAPDGSFWAGTMARDNTPDAGTLYRLDPDRTVRPLLSGLTVSNGLGWSPDGEICYFIDTATQRVDALRTRGDVIDRQPFVTLDRNRGVPDGLTVDAEGNVWIAMCFGGCVLGFDPTAHPIADIEVPAALTTSVTFGGGDLATLFITTGRVGLTEEELRRQPHAGSVFACIPGTTGLPPDLYRG